MRRQLYLWHRYIGIALCLLFALWFVSGVAMMYVRMPILFPADRFAYLQPFDPTDVAITPTAAAERAGFTDAPRRIRLVSLLDRPVYHLLPRGQRWIGVYADNGERLPPISPDTAVTIATRAYPGTNPQYLRTVEEIDQWTLTNSLNLQRPLHRIAVLDDEATEVYVSSVTGEIVMRTTRMERALAWIGPIIHWGAPEVLRTRVALWRQSILWVSFAGTALVISGVWIGLTRYRRRGYHLRAGISTSPYTGWKRWHHWGGLMFGTVTLTWMVSGWLYLNPGGGRSGPLETITTMSPYNVGGVRADNSSRPEHAAALAGGPLEPARFAARPADAWSRTAERALPREVELTLVGGDPYFIVYADWDRSWIVPAAERSTVDVRTRFDEHTLTSLASRMIPGSRVTEARLVHEYDAYYYSVGSVAPKRLPVFVAKFDDPDSTWYYIDAHTGSIFRRYDRYGRVMRWVVNGLHTLDFPFLFANRPAWDLAIISLSAGGLLLSLTGVVIGWRRLTDSFRRKEEPYMSAASHNTLVFALTLSIAGTAAAQDTNTPAAPVRINEEVVVTGSVSREPVSNLASTVQVIDEPTIERSTSTTVTDLLAELGVGFIGKWTPAQTQINLRGATNEPQGREFRSQIVVLINGRRSGTSNLSKLSVDDLRRIEVLRGASSLLYGSQAIGGVINLILKDGISAPGVEAEVATGSFGLATGSAGWGATFGRIDVRFSGHAGRQGDYTSGGDDLPMTNTSWEQRGATASLGFTRTPRERLAVQLRTDGMYDVGFRGSAWDIDNYENRDNNSLDLSYQRTALSERWTFAVSGYRFRDVDDMHWGSEIMRSAQNLPAPGYDIDDNNRRNTGTGFKATTTLVAIPSNTVWAGLDGDWTRLRSTRVRVPVPGAANTQIAPFDNNADTRNVGLFAETSQRLLGDRLTLRGGLRHDAARLGILTTPNFPTLVARSEKADAMTYRGGIVVRAAPTTHVRFGVGSGFRAPTATELAADFTAPQGGQQVGNPDLDPERSRNMEVGVLTSVGRASADLVVFKTDLTDRIALTPLDGNRSLWTNRGTSDISGVEWQLRSDLVASGSTRTWAAVNGNYHFTMRDNEAQRLGLLSDRIQRMYEYQASLRVGVDGSRWTAQVIGALQGPIWYDTEESLLVPFAEPLRTFVHRKDPFWLWNLSGDYDLGRGMRVRAGVTNLLDKNVHPTFIAENREPFLSDPAFALGGRGNSLPGRAFTVGLVLRLQ